jgi:hypothetical protein
VQYRSKKIAAVDGAQIVAGAAAVRTSDRVRNGVLDVLALPYVAATRASKPVVDGTTANLHYGFRRWDWRTERGLELALAKRFWAQRERTDVLEVGNVVQGIGLTGHTIVDKYERGPGVLNVDIMDYEPTREFAGVLCISTLEHIGWDELPQDPDKAGQALRRIATMGRDLLITIPVGCHRQLEREVIDGPFDRVALAVKTSRTARWEQRPLEDVDNHRYGSPFAYGNAVLIGIRG